MKLLILSVGIALLFAALYFHGITQANVIKPVEKTWFERLFTGSRASRDNLNEEGLRGRKWSNICATAGLVLVGIYMFMPVK